MSGQTLDARDMIILIVLPEVFRRCTILAVNVQEGAVRHIRKRCCSAFDKTVRDRSGITV
jgi:hypothetical protein